MICSVFDISHADKMPYSLAQKNGYIQLQPPIQFESKESQNGGKTKYT